VIKRFLKKENSVKGNEDDGVLSAAITRAATIAVTPEIAKNQFRHCKIRL
jgi:hypothetical protein